MAIVVQALPFPVLGVLVSGAITALMSPAVLARFLGSLLTSTAVGLLPALSILALGGLAVLLAICSKADAFVAASLREFSLTARLVFLVVGPAVDVKLIAMQAGCSAASSRPASPLAFAVAVICAVLVAVRPPYEYTVQFSG